MRLCRTYLLPTALILMVAAGTVSAARTTFRYDSAQRVINACVLGIGTQAPDTHPNPYLIEGIRRSSLTPDDWVFENPLASATVVTGDTPVDYVVKGKRDYWFVSLTDETAQQLVGMDLIYICSPDLDLTPAQQDGLQAAAEAGAIVWVDEDVAAGGTTVTNFPWAFEFDVLGGADHARVPLDRRHGLLSEPYELSRTSVGRLGDDPDWGSGSVNVTGQCITNLGPLFHRVVDVGEVGGGGEITNREPFIVAMAWGSGSVVVSTGGVGADVCEWVIEAAAGDLGFAAGRRPSPDPMQAPDVKLALNMIQWNDRWQQARRTPRAAATTVARARGPLDIAWQFPAVEEDPTVNSIGPVVCTPVCGRGMTFAVSVPSVTTGEPARVMCFDIEPEQSLDGDAFPDDGVGDYGDGAPYDMIWQQPLGAGRTPRYSSPTLATVTWVNGGEEVPVQVALVSSVDLEGGAGAPALGYVDCFNATVDAQINAQAELTPGDLLWRRQIEGYSDTADVVALSTPVVHKGFVYVLADEYDDVLGGPVEERAYGRVHCFELEFDWNVGDPAEAAVWEYPSPADNIDGFGSAMVGAGQEEQRSLPCFHDPQWLSEPAASRPGLPPSPGSIPVVHSTARSTNGLHADALLTFGTAVTHNYDETASQVTVDPTRGSMFCMVPAPQVYGTDDIRLNERYYTLYTEHDVTADPPPVETVQATEPVDRVHREGAAADRTVVIEPAAAREAIVDAQVNPIEGQLGLAVLVDTDGAGAEDPEEHFLAGPVRWRQKLNRGERAVQPQGMSADDIVVTGGWPVDYSGVAPPPTQSGGVAELEAESGATQWTYDPVETDPVVHPNSQSVALTGAAMDGDTAVVGSTTVDYTAITPYAHSAIIGLRRQIEASVKLGPALADSYRVSPDMSEFAVTALDVGLDVSPEYYHVDRWSRRLIFPAETAGNVTAMNGTDLGPMYGRAIEVVWAHDNETPDDTSDDVVVATPELHMVPDIERFRHTPDFIRLRHRPVDFTVGSRPQITRPDGTAITGVSPGSAPVTVNGMDLLLDGWIDLRGAADADLNPVLPGDRLVVRYRGWSEREGDFISIPDATLNISVEEHQVPVRFGPSVSSPAVAGNTIHVGTQGLDTDLDADFEDPYEDATYRYVGHTMLSLLVNRSNGQVESSLARPAELQDDPATGAPIPGIPTVPSSPAVVEDRVFVGTRVMATADEVEPSFGYVSALTPWRVLLCDSDRVVETIGGEPGWVCTGTSSPQRAQSFIGEDLRRPLSRPAKARQLQTGHILVVDSGNNRVVEIDRSGQVMWPLDGGGYEYYTSPDNHNLRLSRPADAHRYYDVETVTVGGTDRHFPVLHTVIADTGNARVIDVLTRFHDPATNVLDGRQRHAVRTLTPAYVQVGSAPRRPVRVRYTSAQPIFDPGNDAVVGYLCAAANLNQILIVSEGGLVNPADTIVSPGSGSGAPWRYWAWLYDSDPTDGDHVSNEPLRFENIKHVAYTRHGSSIYVTVTCSRYRGRAGQPDHALAGAGPGVFEFRIDISDPNPDNWALHEMGSGAAWPTEDPHWYFVRDNYVGRPMTTITTAAGTADEQVYDKRWNPVSAQRLRDGRHLICNSLSLIESATVQNIGAGAREAVMGSHIFEVETALNAPDDPTDDAHRLDRDRSVPEPGQMWVDPFVQPAYAEVR